MDQPALLFVLLLGAVITVPLGERLGLPAPVLMTLVGVVPLRRAAYDIGTRISPDIVDEERRDWFARRAGRQRSLQRVQREMLSAARHEVLAARSEPGTDPEVVDRVLLHLDVRSLR